MDPIAVDIRLIRAVLGGELRVAPGRALMARVVAANPWSGRGSLSIAGALIDATLPPGVKAGDELRLTVRDVSPERVVLGLSDPGAEPAASGPPAELAGVPVPLPGGGTVRVSERDAGGGGGGSGSGESGSGRPHGGGPGSDRHTLGLSYDAPALGTVDLRFELDPQSLRLTATFAAGPPLERAQAGADALRDALGEAVGRQVAVEITARREPLDVYA